MEQMKSGMFSLVELASSAACHVSNGIGPFPSLTQRSYHRSVLFSHNIALPNFNILMCFAIADLPTNQDHRPILHILEFTHTSMLLLLPLDSHANDLQQLHFPFTIAKRAS